MSMRQRFLSSEIQLKGDGRLIAHQDYRWRQVLFSLQCQAASKSKRAGGASGSTADAAPSSAQKGEKTYDSG